MPYPSPDDPEYCPNSKKPVKDLDATKQWHRCPICRRPIAAMANGTFHPHVANPKRARRGDAIQEGLMAHGLDTKVQRGPIEFTEERPDE